MGASMRINTPVHRGGLGLRNVVQHLDEIRRHAPLLWALVLREMKARYRSSALGYLWTLLNPLLLLLVYTLVFSIYMRSGIKDYALFLYSGLLPWLWLSSSLTMATTSIVTGSGLITKAMLPPQLLPTTQVLNNLFNMVLGVPVLLAVAWILGRPPSLVLLWLPVLILGQITFVQGFSLAASALCVRLRDVEFLITNLLTFWFFLTPILYSLDFVPARFRSLCLLNPMTPVALVYQDLFYWRRNPRPLDVALIFASGLLVLYLGTWAFERLRDSLAEEI